MRFLALAGLVVTALGVALYLLVVRDTESATADVKPQAEAKRDEVAPAAPAGEMQPRTQDLGQQLKKQLGTVAKQQQNGPSLASGTGEQGAVEKPAVEMTADQRFRFKLIKQVSMTEPAIIDCLDGAKKTGGSVDGVGAYGVYMKKVGDKLVFDGTTVEYSPYGNELNQCIHDSAKQMEIESDFIPDGVDRLILYRKLTVKDGEIAALQMPFMRVTDGAKATPP